MTLNKTHSKRLFVAVEPSQELKPILRELTRKLNSMAIRNLRVISPDMIHLTLRFLGNVSEQQIPYLKIQLSSLIGFEPFYLEFTEIGMFPNFPNAKTLWLGLDGENLALSRLKRAIDQQVTTVHVSKHDRHFIPHLTLARLSRNVVPQELRHAQIMLQNELSNCPGKLRVDNVSLMQSTLLPDGAIYAQIYSHHLNSGQLS
ncbi:RNA 2',3'-cyclic phosphodiesterase [SAR202 cluster bacterium AD-802-E10_MRT_200m]|nr:RNA 2',3'-cyclic phosphodiesterase [SAR202 cluster bacterium AD-802-E10_MRT_200m]